MKKSCRIIVFICIMTPTLRANDPPYFTEGSTVFETRILSRQTLLHSFDTIAPTRIDSIKSDSSFSCRENSCEWSYTYTIDTIQKIRFIYTELDTFTFIDTLVFSFFDRENDSCRFNVRLLDAFGKKIPPDSVWGTLYARPGTGNTLYFSSPLPPAGYRRFILAMNQVENGTDTVFDTISGPSSVSTYDMVATDSSFLHEISGNWRRIYQSYLYKGDSELKSMFEYNSSGHVVAEGARFLIYDGESLVSTNTIPVDNGRVGFSIPYESCGNGYLLFGDTLATIVEKCGQSGYLYTCVYVREQAQTVLKGNLEPGEPVRLSMVNTANISRGSPACIRLRVGKPSEADLSLYDLKGRKVLQPVRAAIQAGYHSLPMPIAALSGQAYLLRLEIDGKVYKQEALIVR